MKRVRLSLGELTLSYPYEIPRTPESVRHDSGETYSSKDRRGEPRIHVLMSVKVCGTDLLQRTFETDGFLENISTGGIYVKFNEQVGIGAKLLIFVRPLSVSVETETTPFGVVRGIVARVEPPVEGLAGVGIRITHRRKEG